MKTHSLSTSPLAIPYSNFLSLVRTSLELFQGEKGLQLLQFRSVTHSQVNEAFAHLEFLLWIPVNDLMLCIHVHSEAGISRSQALSILLYFSLKSISHLSAFYSKLLYCSFLLPYKFHRTACYSCSDYCLLRLHICLLIIILLV